MRTITSEVDSVKGEIELVVISDVHIGSANFNEQLLKNVIEYILEKDNRYCILNGDILDCNFKDSPGVVYQNAMSPSVALSYALLYLKPLADANRIICSIGGNHDHDRSIRQVDISFAQQLAVGLGISDRFSANSVCLFLKVKNGYKKDRSTTFKVFISHGNNGGGGTVGSKANALEKMSLIVPNADVYIHSHTHSPFTHKDEYIEMNDAHQTIARRERLYVNTNAFLNYFDSYGEARLMKPQSLSVPIIKLKAKRIRKENIDRVYKQLSCEI